MVLLQKVHNLLEALLFLDVEAVAELLLVLPVVHHGRPGLLRPGAVLQGRGGAVRGARLVQYYCTVVYGYLDGFLDSTTMICVVGSLRLLVNGRAEGDASLQVTNSTVASHAWR